MLIDLVQGRLNYCNGSLYHATDIGIRRQGHRPPGQLQHSKALRHCASPALAAGATVMHAASGSYAVAARPPRAPPSSDCHHRVAQSVERS